MSERALATIKQGFYERIELMFIYDVFFSSGILSFNLHFLRFYGKVFINVGLISAGIISRESVSRLFHSKLQGFLCRNHSLHSFRIP